MINIGIIKVLNGHYIKESQTPVKIYVIQFILIPLSRLFLDQELMLIRKHLKKDRMDIIILAIIGVLKLRCSTHLILRDFISQLQMFLGLGSISLKMILPMMANMSSQSVWQLDIGSSWMAEDFPSQISQQEDLSVFLISCSPWTWQLQKSFRIRTI